MSPKTDEARGTQKRLPPEHYIFDGVLGVDELLWTYHVLLSNSSWTLTRTSADDTNFRSIVFRIRTLAMKNNGAVLPPSIQRIHVGAKSSFSKTEFHVDSNDENAWTILGFLNPVWNAGDGGEFFLEDHKVEYKSGRFVVFRSNTMHDGGYVKNEKLNYWRIAVNIILDHGESGELTTVGRPPHREPTVDPTSNQARLPIV
jgi:hypothetical protein